MDKKRVLDALATLKAELAGAKEVDPQTRESIERMTGEIERRMQSADASQTDEPLSSQLKDVLLEFGAEHPNLTGAINQVAAALANLGI